MVPFKCKPYVIYCCLPLFVQALTLQKGSAPPAKWTRAIATNYLLFLITTLVQTPALACEKVASL